MHDAPSYEQVLQCNELEEYRNNMEEVQREFMSLEERIASQIPEIAAERRFWTKTRWEVAACLDAHSALAEFVGFDVFDFGAVPSRNEKQWHGMRYIAFVLRQVDDDHDVRMVDLGDSDVLTNIIESHDSLAVRKAIFDPIVSALPGNSKLVLSLDGVLSQVPFEHLSTDDNHSLAAVYSLRCCKSARDLLKRLA